MLVSSTIPSDLSIPDIFMHKKKEERMDKNKRNEQVYAETETQRETQRDRESNLVFYAQSTSTVLSRPDTLIFLSSHKKC